MLINCTATLNAIPKINQIWPNFLYYIFRFILQSYLKVVFTHLLYLLKDMSNTFSQDHRLRYAFVRSFLGLGINTTTC